MSLTGTNYYANKLVELRADATNAFSDLAAQSAGDTSAMAEMIQNALSATGTPAERANAARELVFSLKTTWRTPTPSDGAANAAPADESLFPLAILAQTGRAYLTAIGRQMNGCYSSQWYDASAVMMRRLIEIAVIEAFEAKGIAPKITDASGNYVQLTDLVAKAVAEPALRLSRTSKTWLPQLRDVGHTSAHGRYFHARKEDIDRVRQGCRIVVEEFLHHAGLL